MDNSAFVWLTPGPDQPCGDGDTFSVGFSRTVRGRNDYLMISAINAGYLQIHRNALWTFRKKGWPIKFEKCGEE